jgi:hypothetical protein
VTVDHTPERLSTEERDRLDLPRQPVPSYKTPRGAVRQVTGRYADTWPHPRSLILTAGGHVRADDGVLYEGDAVFVEQPMPWESNGWGLSYGVGWRSRTPIGVFIAQYAEGIHSGFPWWPVVVFSTRAALRWTWRREWRNAR